MKAILSPIIQEIDQSLHHFHPNIREFVISLRHWISYLIHDIDDLSPETHQLIGIITKYISPLAETRKDYLTRVIYRSSDHASLLYRFYALHATIKEDIQLTIHDPSWYYLLATSLTNQPQFGYLTIPPAVTQMHQASFVINELHQQQSQLIQWVENFSDDEGLPTLHKHACFTSFTLLLGWWMCLAKLDYHVRVMSDATAHSLLKSMYHTLIPLEGVFSHE